MRAKAAQKLRNPVVLVILLLAVVFVLKTPWQHGHAAGAQAPGLITLKKATSASQRFVTHSASNRSRIIAFVGVQTGFNAPKAQRKYDYVRRRQQLRATWFPGDAAAMRRLEAKQGVIARFVVGHSNKADAEAEMRQEIAEHGDFLQLDITEAYLDLAKKTLAFFSAVTRLYDADYILKVDDDVYLRLPHVPHVASQWRAQRAGYIGCMKTGAIMQDPKQRWYEPQHVLLGSKTYFAHTWGSAYALSGDTAEFLASMPPQRLRFFSNEDVTVGSWMLAFDVPHFDDRRMCSPSCHLNAVAVYDYPKCAGLCNSIAALPALHADKQCRAAKRPQLVPQIAHFPS